MPDVLLNDTYSFRRPVQISPRRVDYPFENNADLASTLTQVDYIMQRSYYRPAKVGVDRDPDDPLGYVAAPDSNRSYDLRTQQVRFTRTYARIPAQQTVYGSRLIDRPVMHDITAGGYYAVSFDNGVTSHVFSARKTASISGTPTVPNVTAAANRPVLPSGVTVTVVAFGGASGTFDTGDSASAINTALEAIYSTTDYLIMVSEYEINVRPMASGALRQISVSSSLVEIDGDPDNFTIRSASENTASVRSISSTAHGGAAGDLVAAWNGDKLRFTGKVISVTTDALTVQLDDAPGKDDVVTHIQFADTSSTRYVNGPANCTVKEVTDFYLPGVSTGITTPADIALVAAKLDPVSWLTAIQAGTTYVVCEGSQLARWLDGLIYSQTTISVQMSDALDTVAVGA